MENTFSQPERGGQVPRHTYTCIFKLGGYTPKQEWFLGVIYLSSLFIRKLIITGCFFFLRTSRTFGVFLCCLIFSTMFPLGARGENNKAKLEGSREHASNRENKLRVLYINCHWTWMEIIERIWKYRGQEQLDLQICCIVSMVTLPHPYTHRALKVPDYLTPFVEKGLLSSIPFYVA